MMKRKMMVPVVALLLCVAMVSVGFAAWVITTTTSDKAESNFQVYEVTDNRWFFEASVKNNASVVFGAPAETGKDGAWLTATDMVTENLTVTINLTPKADASGNASDWATAKTKFYGKTVKYVVSGVTDPEGKTAFGDATGDNYVTAPSIAGEYTISYNDSGVATIKKGGTVKSVDVDGDGVSYDADTGVLSIEVTFSWGSITGGDNPYDFFNTKKANDKVPGDDNERTYADLALDMLTGIHALEGNGYSVTVTGSMNN